MTGTSGLLAWVDRFRGSRTVVLGDVMLDRFVYGSVSRISPEAPVPVLRCKECNSVPGGAGNVVRNLLAYGAKAGFVSVVGDDPEGRELRALLSKFDGLKSHLIAEKERRTTVKTRFIAGRQQVLRTDIETTHAIGKDTVRSALKAAQLSIALNDVIVLSDYGKGFFCDELMCEVIRIGRKAQKPILVDPKGTDYGRYRGASILTPNLKELSEATGMLLDSDHSIVSAARQLIRVCEVQAVLVTRSRDGMTLVTESSDVIHFKAEAKEVFDVSGAGDTVIATLAAALGAGAPLCDAAQLANVAAGTVVSKVGTAAVYPEELTQALRHQDLSHAEAKTVDLRVATEMVHRWRRRGLKIGFTNGIFDLLHPGHINLLARAARSCDRLIVGLNGDASVKQLRGEPPLQQEAARSLILASLGDVNLVVIFNEETPMRLLEVIKPDLLIKGSNYNEGDVVGADLVRRYGGEVQIIDDADFCKSESMLLQGQRCSLGRDG